MLSVRPRTLGLDGVEPKARALTHSGPAGNRWLVFVSLWLMLAGLVSTNCVTSRYVLLKPSTVEKYKLTAEELRSLQYYVDAPLELSRTASASAAHKIRGRLVTRHDITYEVIQLMPGSPCLATSVLDRQNISVSFEPGADLSFEPGSRQAGDCYVLRYGGSDSTHYRVYGGQTYTQRGTPRLLIERAALTRIAADRESLPGRPFR
jgi:hypothetical protein